MSGSWQAPEPGVLRLPSGRAVRGRGLRHAQPQVRPEFGLYLLGKPPVATPWQARWVRWPDFWLPTDRADACDALRETWRRAETELVEVACAGGRGRTGTALACLAVLDGLEAGEAIELVRTNYDRKAVETPWQRRYVARFRRG